MSKQVDISELKKIIATAEEELEKLKNGDRRKAKQRRIQKALEKAYALLNLKTYTQKQVDKATRVVWRSLQDDGIPFFWLYIGGGLLAAAVLFATYETYSFFNANWNGGGNGPVIPIIPVDPKPDNNGNNGNHNGNTDPNPGHGKDDEPGHGHYNGGDTPTEPTNPSEEVVDGTVTVNYIETNVVNLENLIPVSDTVGLNNRAQKFTITNVPDEALQSVNYKVNYNVNIVEANAGHTKVINKNYIKYRVTYDNEAGEEVTTAIGTLGNLTRNADGSYLLLSGSQAKNASSNFKVVFWLSSEAGNDQQEAAYTLVFKVTAAVEKL